MLHLGNSFDVVEMVMNESLGILRRSNLGLFKFPFLPVAQEKKKNK